jgi:hypothetical protein
MRREKLAAVGDWRQPQTIPDWSAHKGIIAFGLRINGV